MPGWQPLIVCNPAGKPPVPCTFEKLIELMKNGIQDMVLISTLVVVTLLIYIGFKLLTSQGNTNAWTNAKKRLGNVIWGYVWVLAAWLIVYTITSVLLDPATTIQILQ